MGRSAPKEIDELRRRRERIQELEEQLARERVREQDLCAELERVRTEVPARVETPRVR
jgi:hypothetical protein